MELRIDPEAQIDGNEEKFPSNAMNGEGAVDEHGTSHQPPQYIHNMLTKLRDSQDSKCLTLRSART